MAEEPRSISVKVELPMELRNQLSEILMVQYQDGMRDGAKVVREMLKDHPSVTDEVKALIEAVVELVTEEAAAQSQKLHAL